MRMIATVVFATVFASLVAAGPATVRAEDRGVAIASVIERQIAAFQRNDLKTAFGFASPSIQQIFRNPQNFGNMVSNGYPMVWRPSSYQMDRLLETSAGLVQIVVFEDAAGRFHEAGYLMQMIDGKWRINGVHIRERPGVGT